MKQILFITLFLLSLQTQAQKHYPKRVYDFYFIDTGERTLKYFNHWVKVNRKNIIQDLKENK